jgi:hypothetical protein
MKYILLFLFYIFEAHKLKSKIQKFKEDLIEVDEVTGLVNLVPAVPKISARGWLRLSSPFFHVFKIKK